jgi:predicted RNA binding protein YcfA (HicA-like mRNA interferase family)
MSARLRPLPAKNVIRKLKKAGFCERHQRGSHLSLKNPRTGKIAIVPMHGKDIPIGTLHEIVVHQAGLSIERFNKLYF